ncbi:MAG: type II toxin-antitoxin system PemK/MazF family toxin [Candidatus Sulfotelmatobacter sp.]
MVSYPQRDEVWLATLDPSTGSEIKKTRPCLVISPDEMNEPLQTVLVAPMTTTLRAYPTRVNLTFRNKAGQVALDQLRAVDRQRLVKRLGTVSTKTAQSVSSVLVEMFVR